MDMRTKLESIITETQDPEVRALAMSALSHLAVFNAERGAAVEEKEGDNLPWIRRTAMASRYGVLIRDLGIPITAVSSQGNIFDATPA